jgi:GNAT superfamily N-acetyltransferase
MPIILQPLEPKDVDDWVQVHFAAFYPLMPFLWNASYSPESLKILAQKRLGDLNDPHSVVWKAVDTDNNNKIAAVANWSVYKEERTEEELKESLAGGGTMVKEMNQEARAAFIKGIDWAREHVMGTKPCVLLDTLVVNPEYQRRGIGALLMQKVVDEADA